MLEFLQKIFGTKAERDVKKLRPLVARINAIEAEYQKLSDDELKAKTPEFRARLAKGETMDDILPEAYAVVKNACRRLLGQKRQVCGHELVWDMVPFDVQIMGGIVLHQGKIAEMQTGEGKTLVATFPMYLNALSGKGAHLVTVNDYLALRDSQWMGMLYDFLGVSVGCIQNYMHPGQRREQYACDITYGTNSEFGFDYLRDNGMATQAAEQVQRGHVFALIDEVDSILIDEARTPLIISGPAAHSSNQYVELKPKVERLVRRQQQLVADYVAKVRKSLEEGDEETSMALLYRIYHGMPKNKDFLAMIEDPAVRRVHEDVESRMLTDLYKEQARDLLQDLFFTIDEKTRDAALTDKGCAELNPADPEMFVVPDIISAMAAVDSEDLVAAERNRRRQEIQRQFADRSERIQNVDQLLKAYCLYEKDVEYVVMDNRVLIVDEFTGRILPGRRWSDGLHQAVEAKEGVEIERETQTLATITIQNYFRMYKKLSGMTGTAVTEASEFNEIYKLDVVCVPTNRPVRRIDSDDLMFRTQREKYNAIVEDVKERHEKGQPVLLGTVAVETSEILSRYLNAAHIPHNVLNAKNHAREAEIVALAGQKGAVTIATNMAGRGTDIKLGKDVLWVSPEIVHSQLTLDQKPEGETKTLRQLLEERPCGLYVIGSERHDSRRIDRQLRGRCSRQGDPGASCFYVSLEDNLMRLFGSERIAGLMSRLGMKEGDVITHPWLTRSVESAQRKVEERNFSIRKRTLQYDDVMNRQREVVYGFRSDVINAENPHELVLDVIHDIVLTQCENYLYKSREPRTAELLEWCLSSFPIPLKKEELDPFVGDIEGGAKFLFGRIEEAYEFKCSMENPETLPMMERQMTLQAIDTEWQEYLRSLDDLRDSVRLRAYGQRDPLVEYKREASLLFGELMGRIKTGVCANVFRASTSMEILQNFMYGMRNRVRRTQTIHREIPSTSASAEVQVSGPAPSAARPAGPRNDMGDFLDAVLERATTGSGAGPAAAPRRPRGTPVTRTEAKVGRNDPCPCGSGKKYKNCCGKA